MGDPTAVLSLGGLLDPKGALELGGDILTGGAISQRKASKAQRRATDVQARIAQVQNARSRRRAVAAGRRQRATAIASAAGTGAIGSSGLAGFTGGVTSALGANISFQQGLGALESQRLGFLGQAASFQGQAALAGGIRTAATTFLPKPS